MSGKTSGQRAADSLLEQAITAACAAYELPGTGTLIDYIVVTEAAALDDDGEIDTEFYGLLFRHGNARSTVALGLLAKAEQLLMYGDHVDPDEGI